MPMTPREMIKYLKRNGFEEISQNGSHVKMRNKKTDNCSLSHQTNEKRIGAGYIKTGGNKIIA